MGAAVGGGYRAQDRGADRILNGATSSSPIEQEGTKAVVKTWLKTVGDTVRGNDPVVELETDKVAVEIAAEADGVLSEILLAEGAEVEPGSVLGRIADAAQRQRETTTKRSCRPVTRATSRDAAHRAQCDAAPLPPGHPASAARSIELDAQATCRSAVRG